MPKRFIKGNVYVFTKKKFMQERGKRSKDLRLAAKLFSKGWVNLINGNEVTIEGDWAGKVNEMFISPDWCKCIKNNNPKVERKEIAVKDKTINLCDTCKFEIPSCKATEEGTDFKFGNGLGNDNVYECKIYKLKSEGI